MPIANYPHSYLRLRKLLINLRDSIYENEKQIAEAEAEIMGQIPQPIATISNLSKVENIAGELSQ